MKIDATALAKYRKHMYAVRKAGSVPQLIYQKHPLYAKKLTKVIGIISYFPDEQDARDNRKQRCFDLLRQIKKLFNLPTMIIAQNWTDQEEQSAKQIFNKVDIKRYDKLGIVGARTKLRETFLTTNYDYMIMLDDDSHIVATEKGIKNYLYEIDSHPGMFGLFKFSFLRLAAISRDAYALLDLDPIQNLSPEGGQIWEDHCYIHTFANLYFDKVFKFSRYEIDEDSVYSQHDPYSIWYKNQDQSKMGYTSDKIIEAWVKLKGGKIDD